MEDIQPCYEDCPHMAPATPTIPMAVEIGKFVEDSIPAKLVALTEKLPKKGPTENKILTTYQYPLLLPEPPP